MTGSDQVWGPVSTGTYDSAYFLDFVPKGNKKIAFASSFGKAKFNEKTMKEYKQYLVQYDKIAVREDKAVEILDDIVCFSWIRDKMRCKDNNSGGKISPIF